MADRAGLKVAVVMYEVEVLYDMETVARNI